MLTNTAEGINTTITRTTSFAQGYGGQARI